VKAFLGRELGARIPPETQRRNVHDATFMKNLIEPADAATVLERGHDPGCEPRRRLDSDTV